MTLFFHLFLVAGGEWKASSSEAALTRQSIRIKEQLNLHAPKTHCSSDVIAPGRGGILRSPRRNHTRCLNNQRASVPVELTLKTGFPGSNSQLQNLSSPAQKGRTHRHRRAVRRARSTTDTWSVGHSYQLDPREPQFPSEDVAASARHLTSDAHIQEKSDLEGVPLETFEMVSKFHQTSSPSWKQDPEISSLSSYKETSPETEMIPSVAKPLRLSSRKSDDVGRIKAADLRMRTFNYSRDSLETYKERWQRKSQPEKVQRETVIVHVEPKVSTTLGNRVLDTIPSVPPPFEVKVSANSISDSDSSVENGNIETDEKSAEFTAGEMSESSHTLTAVGELVSKPCEKMNNSSLKSSFKECFSSDTNSMVRNIKAPSLKLASLKTCGHDKGAGSQQSSLVGLQWLFSTDSDSQTSGE